jgi:hypothetical protein
LTGVAGESPQYSTNYGIVVLCPTICAVGKRAAFAYFILGLTSPFVRRIIGWLRRMG